MRPASCRPPHLFLCFRFLLFYLSAACRLPRTRKMEQHQQLFATSPPYFDHQQELKTEGSTGMNSHNKAALYPSIKLSPPANSFARFSREATDDSRPQLASLEEAKLLASLAEVTPLESQSENIKRDLNALWDNRREDLDEDLLVCHEKLGDELFPSKRPRLSTFQVSESSPFRPYPRKEKIPPKTTLLSPKAPRLDNNAKNEVAIDSYVFGVPNGHAYPPTLSAITPAAAHWYHPRFEFPPHAEENFVYHHFPSGSPPRRMCHSPVGIKNTVNPGSYYVPSHPHNADFLYRHRPSKGPARNDLRPVTVLSKKFSWKQCPEVRNEGVLQVILIGTGRFFFFFFF